MPLESHKAHHITAKSVSWRSCIGLHLASFLPPPRCFLFLSDNVIFRGLRLSLGHFVPESPVSQLHNCVSASSLPPFFVELLTFKIYQRSNSFFNEKFGGVQWLISHTDYNGPGQQWKWVNICLRSGLRRLTFSGPPPMVNPTVKEIMFRRPPYISFSRALCQGLKIPVSTVEPTNPPISLYQTRNFWAWQTCALNIQRFPYPNICLGIRSTETEVLIG